MTRALCLFAALNLVIARGLLAGEPPDWFRRDPVKAVAGADLIVMAKIRDVSVISKKTGRTLKKLPISVDEYFQGFQLRLTLEQPRVLWPAGGSSPNELTISMNGVSTAAVTPYKNSTVILLLAKRPDTKPQIYEPANYWPFADATDLEAVQGVIASRTAEAKPK